MNYKVTLMFTKSIQSKIGIGFKTAYNVPKIQLSEIYIFSYYCVPLMPNMCNMIENKKDESNQIKINYQSRNKYICLHFKATPIKIVVKYLARNQKLSIPALLMWNTITLVVKNLVTH